MKNALWSALLGAALLGGCATEQAQMKTHTVTKTERWTCPAGTRPDARIREPNCAIKEETGQPVAQAQQQQQQQPQAEEKKEEKECPPTPAPAPRVQFEKRVEFETASAKLGDSSKATLDEVATTVREDPGIRQLRVGGHADSTGTPDINETLAQERAEAVKDYLIEQGVPEQKIDARSFSDEAPVASNDSPDGRAMNRSVVIIALK